MNDAVSDLIRFLDASPSPWHVASTVAQRLRDGGFQEVDELTRWDLPVAAGFVTRGAAVVAWRRGTASAATDPLRIVGAHTDSPCLRVKPRPDAGLLGWRQLGVEVYGSALLSSWLDRDLGIAGRVVARDGRQVDVLVDDAVCRVPQLAIHLDRDVNDRGLVLDKQQHLTPVWGSGAARDGDFAEWLAAQLPQDAGMRADDLVSWDLSLFDRTPAVLLGADRSLLASGRIDNQVSCWAAVRALLAATPISSTAVVCLFDHEEAGSASTTGAAGPLLEHIVERLALAAGADRADLLTQLARSTCISADCAHAVHPNYPERHEPAHRPLINEGPAIKVNANQRYATSAATEAMAERVFAAAGVPTQRFVSRNNVPCGSTIGPITAARLGIATVDVGIPQLSMHSARELCGARDPTWLADGLTAYLAGGS